MTNPILKSTCCFRHHERTCDAQFFTRANAGGRTAQRRLQRLAVAHGNIVKGDATVRGPV